MDPANSKVSIVSISYNQAPFLEDCIRSVAGQGHSELEYIVVDPGSTDGSRDIIKKHSSDISHAVLEPDDGPADGLNRGFARATGEIYGYLNADDRFSEDSLEYVAQYFSEHPEVDVLCGAIQIIDEQGRASPRARTSDRFDLAAYVAGFSTICQQATFFRRQAFEAAGGFNAANRVSWDGELLVDMALAGCRFATVRKVLGQFRLYSTSISGSQSLANISREENSRIKGKIRASGVRLYGSLEEALRRMVYKLNPVRHLGYWTVR